tara:strand:- start:884 stop:1180 length:297 start_codon:yes stop_codon:yes gene_type:complete
MLADAWVEKYGNAPKQETADELAARLVKEARTKALDRALGDLTRGFEARPSDKELFGGDPHMNLRYWDARDEAVARFGDALEIQRDEANPEDEEGDEQ